MTPTEINSKEFVDEIFKKLNCMNRFETRLAEIIKDPDERERVRKLFSDFIVDYHS